MKPPRSAIVYRARWMLAMALLAPAGCHGGDVTGTATGARKRPLPVPFRVIAHRGASAYAPENTLPAFERALEVGAAEVELDVQLSRDDVLVLFHDRTLDRKTNLTGRVRDHAADALRGADIGSWFDDQRPGVD